MTTATTPGSTRREPELVGQTVIVIGGSAGIGLETARRARAEGADVILTGRNPQRLKQAVLEVGAQHSEAFDANDAASLERFFRGLPTPIDHVMVTAGGPHYGPLLAIELEEARRGLTEHVLLAIQVAQSASRKVRPGGTLLFMGGTGGRHPSAVLGIASAVTVAMPALVANLALELAPVRVNLIAAGFVGASRDAANSARRHATVGLTPRRGPRPASRCRTGRRRRPRRSHHDQHRAHGRDVRHRRRPAAGGEMTSKLLGRLKRVAVS